MLTLTIPGIETYDEKANLFSTTKNQIIQLEHSLVSLSKWESKWCKPFLSKSQRTHEEDIDYIKFMTLTQNVPSDTYLAIDGEILKTISAYIEAPMTATTFSSYDSKKIGGETITAEIIYYWMISFTIPWEAQKWHLNRLLTLIKVCNIKNQPPKKRSRESINARNTALNAARLKALNTRG